MRRLESLIFMIVVLLFVVGCTERRIDKKQTQREISKVNKTETTKSISTNKDTQKIIAFFLSGTTNGKKWSLEGKSANILNSNIVKLEGVTVKNYLASNNIITVTADHGSIDKKKNIVRLNQNVLITTKDGFNLKTEHLNWNIENEYIWTDDLVEIEKNNIRTIGVGASGYSNMEDAKLKKDVKIEIAPSTIIMCKGPLKINYKAAKGQLEGNVEIVDGHGRLIADKAEFYFSKSRKKITKVIAMGNVKIKRGSNVTHSGRAAYFVDEKRIVLTEQPQLLVYSKQAR